MGSNLFVPLISYGWAPTEIDPGVPPLPGKREPLGNDKSVHVAGDGTALTWNVGEREFLEVTFNKQTEALKTAWEAWWDWARVGKEFLYYDDGSFYEADGTLNADGTASASELTTAGATFRELRVKADMQEFTIEEDDVYGYYVVSLRLRRVP